jgi:hypothetical protein
MATSGLKNKRGRRRNPAATAHRAPARIVVDLRRHGVPDFKLAGLHFAHVAEHVGLDLLRIGDREQRQARCQSNRRKQKTWVTVRVGPLEERSEGC